MANRHFILFMSPVIFFLSIILFGLIDGCGPVVIETGIVRCKYMNGSSCCVMVETKDNKIIQLGLPPKMFLDLDIGDPIPLAHRFSKWSNKSMSYSTTTPE